MTHFLLALLMSFSMGFGGTPDTTKGDEPLSILIRVTSNDPESEAVVQCAYMINDEKKTLEVIEKETPFEIRVKASTCYALFRQKSEKGDMAAQLLTIEEYGEQTHVSGSGEAFVMGCELSTMEKPADSMDRKKLPKETPRFFVKVF